MAAGLAIAAVMAVLALLVVPRRAVVIILLWAAGSAVNYVTWNNHIVRTPRHAPHAGDGTYASQPHDRWRVADAVALIPHAAASAGSLNCDIGPIFKSYGKTEWYVYSCDDNRTVVVVSAPGNPATPFYFMFSPNESGYRLVGEGTGRKDATSAAFDDLKTLSEEDIAALIEQTRAH